MDDDLASLLMHGYNNPDLNPETWADETAGTSDLSRIMHAQKTAKDREAQEALTRLFTTAAIPMAAAHSASGNLPKAIGRHVAQERKEGNPMMGPIGLPLGLGIYGGGAALGVHEALTGNPWGAAGLFLNTAALAGLSKNHITSTARILEHLNRTEPKTHTLY